MKLPLMLLFATSLMAPAVRAEVYELRTYTTADGRLADVLTRFRNHATRLFAKHGMKSVGYWVPQDAPGSKNTVIFILTHKDRQTAAQAWDAFFKDPEWIKAKTESEARGPIVLKMDSVFMDPTDFSPLK